MLQNYIDSYLVVAYALAALQDTGMTAESSRLTNTLHLCVQELSGMGLVRYLNSCLLEVLENALTRFAQMGACRADVYDSAAGRKVVYVRVNSDEEMSRKLEQAT